MSNLTSEYYYWDASVFLAYLRNEDGRADTIQRILEEVSTDRNVRVATSAQSIVEVTHVVRSPRPKLLTTTQEQIITDLLEAPYVRLVEVTQGTYYMARDLMRQAMEYEWSLKPYDAVHLATAAWLHTTVGRVRAIHSYDQKWHKLGQLVGGIVIAEPFLIQPTLGLKQED